jgi:hypothetical protein
MATEQKLHVVSLPADADLSTKQYYMLKLNNSSGVARAAVAGEGSDVVGILQNVPNAANRAAEVAIGGISKCIAGGSITAGNRVSPDSNGKATAVGSSDDYAFGVALDSAAAGDIFRVLIRPIGLS